MASAESDFVAYGPSHWVVLVLAAVGAAVLVMIGRYGDARLALWCARAMSLVILTMNLAIGAWTVDPHNLYHSLPLQLSDLAPYAAAYALWSRRPWATSLTYYWGIVLSAQALFTPVLRGPDFPSITFLAFFVIHALVIWAAIFLAWGLRLRPTWREYGIAVAVTACWAAAMLVLNSAVGSNYGFLNAKPPTGSLLDLLGPWPWYLLPECALILTVWALMTVRWRSAKHKHAVERVEG